MSESKFKVGDRVMCTDDGKLGAMKPMQYDWYIRAVGLALITNKN